MHNAPAITYYNTACKTIVGVRKHVVRFCFAFLYTTISAGPAIKRALFVCWVCCFFIGSDAPYFIIIYSV